ICADSSIYSIRAAKARSGDILDTPILQSEQVRMPAMNTVPPSLRIQDLALLLETIPDLQAQWDEWLAFCQPASPGERALAENAFLSLVQGRRVLEAQTETLNHQIRTARRRLDLAQEDQVEEARTLFKSDPARAVLLLKRTAMGCRWMI